MNTPADRGLLDMQGRILAELLADTTFKDNLRDLLLNIDPENSRQLVRTFMGKDPEVPLAVVCALPAIANCLIKAADELFIRIREQFSPDLLREFIRSLMEEIDRESLLRAAASAGQLLNELSPVIREVIKPPEMEKQPGDRG